MCLNMNRLCKDENRAGCGKHIYDHIHRKYGCVTMRHHEGTASDSQWKHIYYVCL